MSDDDKTKTDDVKEEAEDEKPAEEAKEESKSDEKEDEQPEEEEKKDDKGEEEKSDSGEPEATGMDQQGRQLYKVKCSKCGKDTEVPFKPSGGRPVYCRDCYMQQKN